MQRLAVTLSTFALVFVMIVNIALFVQNATLRKQITATQLKPTQAAPTQDQINQVNELQQKLDRAEEDRLKALRDANTARNQMNQLQGAAQERDTLRSQTQALQQENQQLKLEVGNLQTMNTINKAVVPIRGLAPLQAVPRNFMNHDQLRTYYTDMLDKEWPAEAEQRYILTMQALDMNYGNGNLRAEQIDSFVKDVLGFYDQNTKQLIVVTDHAKMTVTDKVTYAHEFTHSLQDQHFDLTKLFARAANNSDYEIAIRALVEGDATLTMSLYANANLDAIEKAKYQLEQFKNIDMSSILNGRGGPLVESATYFPYEEGLLFVATLYSRGGTQAIDAAFENPPRSSEQVLHLSHYFDGDEPVNMTLPALNLPGWHVIGEDTLGELYIRIYLEYKLPIEIVLPAAAGWGGDRYAVLSNDQGQVALVLQTAWDNVQDAKEFYDAYSRFVDTLSVGTLNKRTANETHIRWQLADRQFYLSLVGKQVLVLHAPDVTTLDQLIAQFNGF